MNRRAAQGVVGVLLAVTLAGCGVTSERKPEPLPPLAPAILPPTVTQQAAPDPPGPLFSPTAVRRAG